MTHMTRAMIEDNLKEHHQNLIWNQIISVAYVIGFLAIMGVIFA